MKLSKTPFLERTRTRQKTLYITAKNQIRSTQPVLGGLFYTHHDLENKPVWADVYFLGKKPVVYLAFFQTAKLAYLDALEEQAGETSEQLLPYRPVKDWFKKSPDGTYGLKHPHNEHHEEFGGLTRLEWENAETLRLADAGNTSVREGVKLFRDYPYNIGIGVTLDVSYFTVEIISDFIRGFLPDPRGWKGDKPLSWPSSEMLPPGPYANPIVCDRYWQKAVAKTASKLKKKG